MLDTWTFGRKLALGFSVAVLTLLVIAGAGYRSINELVDNDRLVTHTTTVREDLARLLATVTDAETGGRGFIITGKDAFLDPLKRARGEVAEQFATLKTLTSDNPAQQERLDTLHPLIQAKLAEVDRLIDIRRESGFDAAQEQVAGAEGKRLMDQVRSVIQELDHEELALLTHRHNQAENSARTALQVIGWGSLFGMGLVALVGYYIARSLTLQIGAAVGRMQSSSTELQSAANQQASGSKEQATSMAEITTTISELLATAKQIAESARRVSGIAEDTAGAAQGGNQLVQRTHESIESIQRQVDLIVSHMLDLGRKSQQIGSILELINELAEQTNILAINATIEAAGAGESGKRFAVVGEEIRRLADRVGASTKEIRQLIDDIRTAVNKTVMTTEGGNKAVGAGARQFAEVATSFSRIAEMVATTTEAAREIELSTRQQLAAVEQVNMAASNVAQASKETEASSNQTFQTASELVVLARQLMKLVRADVKI
jgi:CHASE3 domain sensor protein